MSKRMIIDATHSEETRVALIDPNNRLTDFDFESTTKLTVRGNIYLAKVARVEPSLQAAFIDYGGNRHGFLAFSEIHPDYFRIPMSDREALKAEMQNSTAFEENFEESAFSVDNNLQEDTNSVSEDHSAEDSRNASSTNERDQDDVQMPIAILGGDTAANDDEDFVLPNRPPLHQMYKIQEVIHKNQILLVQVAKEERGLKGAALTTYLSLAGRYGVLMPNSPRSGGISRKISNSEDRTRLKKILEFLDIPEGMGLIIRTAGRERTKVEIKKDAEFLMRAWNGIRDSTLQSIAPSLIHEEDDIIKRAIRDLYGKEVEEIHVEGEEGYKIARSFMKNLMPSHMKHIHHYKDENVPLFHKYKVEAQIDEMHNPVVHLPSGGSIVIHPTEALVSIDINSGRSTRERHIEETAFKTNLEAADEIARQVRLRDLAGLIVIDFIDMEENRNIAAVERRLREAFRHDRARIQMGKIGPFGLLELSRQRIRPSILETSAHPCPHCHATGYVRSTESTSLYMLRAIEEEASSGKMSEFQVHMPVSVAFYLLNTKRDHLQRLEARLKVRIFVEGDDSLITPDYRVTCLKRRTAEPAEAVIMKASENTLTSTAVSPLPLQSSVEDEEDFSEENSALNEQTPGPGPTNKRNRHRRARRRFNKNRQASGDTSTQPASATSFEGDNSGNTDHDFVSEEHKGQSLDFDTTQSQGEGEGEGEPNQNQETGNERPRQPSRHRRRHHNRDRTSPQNDGSGNTQSSPLSSSKQSNENTSSSSADFYPDNKAPVFDKSSETSVNKESSDLSPEPRQIQKKKTGNAWWKRLLDN